MGEYGVFSNKLILCFLHVTVVGVHGQFKVKKASSIPTNGNSNVTCSPAHNLMIRTAHYLATPSASEFANEQPSSGCVGGDCLLSIQNQYKEMTSADVLKIYHHCHSRDVEHCDVSAAGVERDFEMSYFCLNEPLLDPCSNITTEEPQSKLSFLVDYSRHTTARDVICQCTVNMTSSDDDKLYVRALNLFEGGPDKVVSGEEDGAELETNASLEGRGLSMEGRGLSSRRGPVVLIDSTDLQLRWEVERRVTPIEGQLVTEANTTLFLLFDQLQSITFGRVWIDLQGQDMQVSCNYSSIPGVPLMKEAAPRPSEEKKESKSTLMIYISSAAGGVVFLVLIVSAILLVRCRRPPRSNKVHSLGPAADDSLKQPETNNDCSLLEGDYCTINEANRNNRTNSRDQDAKHPRDQTHPMHAETSFMKQTTPNSNQNGDIDQYHPHTYEDKQLSEEGAGRGQSPTLANTASHCQTDNSEYGTLCHRPVPLPRSEPAIYDHAGKSGPGGEEAEYHQLQHGRGFEPKIIDNVYDTANNVTKR